MKLKFNRNPADRSLWEKIARRFILPPHGPSALPLGSWGKRDERLRARFPIRFFVWDTLPDFWSIQVVNRYKAAKNWIRFRTWDRYDVLRLEISKDYHDPDYRMLHANFQILKDFVEIELAAWQENSEDDTTNASTKWFLSHCTKTFHRYKKKQIRRGDLGLKHLEWEIEETQGNQRDAAKEKKILYLWWTVSRPLRADVYDSPLFEKDDGDVDLKTLFNKPFNRRLANMRSNLEEFYTKEDEEMLIRLMRIRRSLWT